MSRGNNKNPVGFATHITAGGMAGACEAVDNSFVIDKGYVLTAP